MTATVGSEVGAAGDEVARLYRDYAPKLRRFCLGRLRSAEDADDAVQTVFLRVYTALRGGTAPVYEAAWLYKIAHNVCLSRIESGAARSRVEQPQDLDALQDVLAAPGDRRDELVGLADALAAMPANLRQAILLREWQGLSYAEIAEALGVSVSAVETLIFRARRHLAAALERGVGTARSAAALLQLPWLLRRLRSLPASGRGGQLGLAKVSAVAVLAAGGVGAGVATSVLGAPARATTTAGAQVVAGRSAPPARTAATAVQPLALQRRTAHRATTVSARTPPPAVSTRAPGVTTTATVRPPQVVPAAVPRTPVRAPAVPPVASTPLATTSAPTSTKTPLATTTVAALPASTVAVPETTVPAVVPTVSVPALPLPASTVSAPAVAVPTVPVLTVTTPVVTTATPGVTVPLPALP